MEEAPHTRTDVAPASPDPEDQHRISALKLEATILRLRDITSVDLEHLIETRRSDVSSIIGAISTLHQAFVVSEENPTTIVSAGPARNSPPMHERIQHRELVFLDSRREARAAQSTTPVNSQNFELSSMPTIEVRLPVIDMFYSVTSADIEKDSFTIYPGLAAYYLKHIVQNTSSMAKAKIVDFLDDRQLVDLLVYSCVLHKNLRQPDATLQDLDRQTRRLLLQVGGKSDVDIAGIEGKKAETTNQTSYLRKSRRTVIMNLRQHSDAIFSQAQELADNPNYRIVLHDPIHGLRVAPEIVDSLETTFAPTDYPSPLRIINIAIKRYLISSLTSTPPKPVEVLRNNVQLIWMKVNGFSEGQISDKLGMTAAEQTAALLELRDTPQRSTNISRQTWRQIRDIVAHAQDKASSVPPAVISPPLKPASALLGRRLAAASDNNSPITDNRASTIINKKFTEHIESVIKNEKLLAFITWAMTRNPGWSQQMLCKDDPESLSTDEVKGKLPKHLLDRCVACPVRLECLGNALGNPEQGTLITSYHYAAYSPEMRTRILQRAGLSPDTINTTAKRYIAEHRRGLRQ